MGKRTDIDEKNRRANLIYQVLSSKKDVVSTKELMKLTNLTEAQIRNTVEYARDRALLEYHSFIQYYFISSRKGYRIASGVDDYAKCFVTLRSWARTLLRRIGPMERYLNENGVRTDTIEYPDDDDFESHLSEYIGDSFGAPDSDSISGWFLEEDGNIK